MNGIHSDYGHQQNWTGRQEASDSQQRRIPTVEEALPYTPFTSIIPFDSGERTDSFPAPLAK